MRVVRITRVIHVMEIISQTYHAQPAQLDPCSCPRAFLISHAGVNARIRLRFGTPPVKGAEKREEGREG